MTEGTKIFKDIFANMPTGVAVVSTVHEDNKYGLTINSFAPVSLKPLLVSFCIDNRSSCHQAFLDCKNIAINFLSSSQEEIALKFASKSVDKFLGVKLKDSLDLPPILSLTMGYMILEKYNAVNGGDHTIIFGKVLESYFDETKKALAYYKRKFVSMD